MPEYSIIENPSHKLWESLLDMCPEGNFEQSFAYGDISEMAFPNTHAIRLAITYDGKPVALVQGTYSRYLGFGMNLQVMRGPVAKAKNQESLWLIEKLLRALEEYAKRKRIIHAQILVPEAWNMQETIDKLGFSLGSCLNEYVVKLEKNPEELWAKIAHNKRKNIKKANKNEVEVIQSHNIEDLHTFYSMFEAAKKRKGFSSYPLSWFESVWKVYEPAELLKVFLARYKGKDVSGVFVVIHGKTVYALAAGSFTEGWKVRANDITHWKIMKWACQNNYSKYCMGLVSEPPPAEGSSSWGVWRWKREWKGSLERIQIFDKLLMPKYKLVLKGKKLAERAYSLFK
jgi:lipid II:glycine glycyltransferase (peptidoglycan interpeptide bridge formation enzyme)